MPQEHARGRHVLRAALLVLSLALSSGSASAGTILYGITHFSSELIRIDTATGAGSLVGTVNAADNPRPIGLATFGSSLYTYGVVTDRLWQLDPVTGAVVASVDLGLPVAAEGALTISSTGAGVLSGRADLDVINTQRLWSFDLAGSSSLITATFEPMDGLDFSPAGALFGLSQEATIGSPYDLYTIHPATGAPTLLGPTGISFGAGFSAVAGLAFRDDGALFAVMNDSLYRLDTGTGAATLVGATGFNAVAGLTFVDVAVPEPAIVAMLAMGWLGVGVYRRRRHTTRR